MMIWYTESNISTMKTDLYLKLSMLVLMAQFEEIRMAWQSRSLNMMMKIIAFLLFILRLMELRLMMVWVDADISLNATSTEIVPMNIILR